MPADPTLAERLREATEPLSNAAIAGALAFYEHTTTPAYPHPHEMASALRELLALRPVAEAARSVAERAEAFDDKRDTDGISMSLWRLRDLAKRIAALDALAARETGG